MAVNYSDLTPGTAVTWMNLGGDKTMTLKNKANGVIQEGAKSATLVDGTKGFPEVLRITVETKLGVAPTDGNEMRLFLGFSGNSTAGTDNPGGLTGADAVVADSDQLPQLVFAGSVIVASSLGTGVQRQVLEVEPKKEYVIPVIQNSTGQTTSNVDSETKVVIQPWYRRTPIA